MSLPWSSAALRAVYDVEPNFPAARRKGAGGDDAEHASASALTELWQRLWPDSRPIAPDLRSTEHRRWVRFHSLPESKQYADNELEYTELLLRHRTVLRELAELDDVAESSLGDLLVVTCSWSLSPTPPLRPAPVMAASPGAWHWLSLTDEDEDDELPIWTHLFVERIDQSEPRLDTLLRMVADDVTEGVIITNPKLTWLYHPYDGGADVIAANPQDRDELRSRHVAWLSPHSHGM